MTALQWEQKGDDWIARDAVAHHFIVGYQGWRQSDLLQEIERLGALLVDIRFTPWSPNPQWTLGNLRKLLGEQYVHIKALGNAEHKTGGMRILHYEAGRDFLGNRVKEMPRVLMCACADRDSCHRAIVADMLIRDGFGVAELQKAERRRV